MGIIDQASLDRAKAGFAIVAAEFATWGATVPPDSPNGTKAVIVVVGGVTCTIRAADKIVLRDGVATSGHASMLCANKGVMYSQSPTGAKHWWRLNTNNSWTDLGNVDPATL